MRHVDIVVDLQFGSTGKGLLCGYLAEKQAPDTIVTAWGPNAGHTYINAEGRKFVNIALPNGIVSPALCCILIGPGSVINPERMRDELMEYDDLIGAHSVRILIHEHAAVVLPEHREKEATYGFKIGSTMKGVGEAVIDKIRRFPIPQNVAKYALVGTVLEPYVVSGAEYQRVLSQARNVLIEGAQGYSLGINSGFYPYTTSRECTVQQLMVDCAIPFHWVDDFMIHGVCRTYPIRVANRFKDGVQVGTSGPCYPDQREMQWSEIEREPELTTVTKLPRRLFTFSEQQIKEACAMNGVHDVFLNFANYVGEKHEAYALDPWCKSIAAAGVPLRWLGWGPTVNDIMEI